MAAVTNTDIGETHTKTPKHDTAERKWLHPEVKNFLGDETFVMRVEEAKIGGTLTRLYGSDPKGFNAYTQNDGELSNNIGAYVSMEAFGTRSRKEPEEWVKMLAERIEITDDYKEYTIYLRKGIKWHKPVVDWSNPYYKRLKGDHYVTAKDVKFSLDVILNNQVECPRLRYFYEDLESVKVIDDYTVVIRWKNNSYNSIALTIGLNPIPEFLYAYDEDGKPLPKETFGLKFNDHWYKNAMGCGPYEFVSYEPGLAIKLKRFEDYYGDKPAIGEINWLIYPDQKQNLMKLKSNALDFCTLSPTEYREEILNGMPDSPFKNGEILHETFNEMVYTYIGWNNEHFIFKDRRVRQAMSYALNCDFILKNIFMGLGNRATGPLYIHSPAYDNSLLPYNFNLVQSKKLLVEAGWRDSDGDRILEKSIHGNVRRFEFDLLMPQGSPEWTAAMNMYKENLLSIGVKMNIIAVDWAVLQKRMDDRDFDAVVGAWAMPWEHDPFQIWHGSRAAIFGSLNHISFRNREADKIIEDLGLSFDTKKRIELYHKFHKVIYDEQPYTFFFSRKRCAVWHKSLHRVVFNILRPHTDSQPWYIDKKAH